MGHFPQLCFYQMVNYFCLSFFAGGPRFASSLYGEAPDFLKSNTTSGQTRSTTDPVTTVQISTAQEVTRFLLSFDFQLNPKESKDDPNSLSLFEWDGWLSHQQVYIVRACRTNSTSLCIAPVVMCAVAAPMLSLCHTPGDGLAPGAQREAEASEPLEASNPQRRASAKGKAKAKAKAKAGAGLADHVDDFLLKKVTVKACETMANHVKPCETTFFSP
jgi:hypothetical protein